MRLRIGSSWSELVAELSQELRARLDSPFAKVRVLVDSWAAGRLLRQGLAGLDGVCAGVTLFDPAEFARSLATSSGRDEEHRLWHGPRLTTAILEELDESDSPRLHAHLNRPGRRLAAAERFADLFRAYLLHSPERLASWLIGEEAPAPFEWQPPLLRGACERLGVNPIEHLSALAEQAAQEDELTLLFGLRRLPTALAQLVLAAHPQAGWFVGSAPEWAGLGDAADRAPSWVSVEYSHTPARQVEVLRDELTRRFAEDPTLQPRDVLIVARPERWANLLNAVFRPGGTHPGRELRVARLVSGTDNPLFEATSALVGLAQRRATASEVVELLLHPMCAHWGFRDRPDELRRLVSDARIRWGFDAESRAAEGVGAFPENTWISGVDALLTGIAMGGEIGPRGVAGTETVTAGDLDLIGALAEVVGRLWRFVRSAREPRNVAQWCSLVEETMAALFLPDPASAWRGQQFTGWLRRLADLHSDSLCLLSCPEFSRLLNQFGAARPHRTRVGDGEIHVVAPEELVDVDRRVTFFLGVTDSRPQTLPDEALPLTDPAAELFEDLLGHARSSEKVTFIVEGYSGLTGAKRQPPVLVERLLRQLSVPVERHHHSPQPSNASAFGERPSFDPVGYRAALLAQDSDAPDARSRLRQEARTLPVELAAQSDVTLRELSLFLADPVKTFLRGRAGVRWLPTNLLDDSLSLDLAGLENWQVTSSFIEGRLAGREPAQLMRAAKAEQIGPPGDLGRRRLAEAGRRAEEVVAQANKLRSGAARKEPIDLKIDGVRLSGSIDIHGERLVHVAASSSSKPLLACWLQLLAATAIGIEAHAVLLRPGRDGVFRTQLSQPGREDALGLLARYLVAFQLGRNRLLPAAFQPALNLVREQSRGQFSLEQWRSAERNFKWSFPDPLWRVFYRQLPGQLFDDPPTELCPSGRGSSFERWAHWLYADLVMLGGAR